MSAKGRESSDMNECVSEYSTETSFKLHFAESQSMTVICLIFYSCTRIEYSKLYMHYKKIFHGCQLISNEVEGFFQRDYWEDRSVAQHLPASHEFRVFRICFLVESCFAFCYGMTKGPLDLYELESNQLLAC